MRIPPQFQGEAKIRAIKDLNLFKGVTIEEQDWKTLAENIKITYFPNKTTIIRQNDFGNKIYFIFLGSVKIVVNGKTIVGERKAGEHVGEISAIFTKMKRTATVETQEDSFLGEMPGIEFTPLLEKYPILYRNIASTLAQRLERRNCLVRTSQQKPVVFIGSSTEGLKKLNKIAQKLESQEYVIKKWNSDVFKGSKTTIENLEKMLDEADFGIILLTPDDRIETRGKKFVVPRDNLIFELGLLMGKLSRIRTLFIVSNKKIKLPSDIQNVQYFTPKNTEGIIQQIQKYGCR